MSPTIGTSRGRTPDPRACRIHLPSSRAFRPPDSRSGRGPKEEDDHAIRCAACGAEVTRREQAIAVNGRHQHAFFNPAGIAFEIRCFRLAPGTISQGEPTAEFTWFSGYRWQLTLCTACHAHLGWRFTDDNSFYGLIEARLT